MAVNTETNQGTEKNVSAGKEAVSQYDDKHLQELYDTRHEKKGARRAFHLVNFLGLHQLFNNTASVIITYFLTTTHLADMMKTKMATAPIGQGLSYVLALPGKAVNGIFKVCGMDLNKGLKSLPAQQLEEELKYRATKSQRSAIETAFMCIAGFIALFPVYYLENHRVEFLNKVDGWLHPGRSKKEKEASALRPGEEPKETWWRLIAARFVALGVVFGVDQTRDNIDSILKYKGKPNVDTVLGWGLGNKIYDKMPEGMRGWLARFFSGSLKGDNIALSSIQHEVREDVLKHSNAPPALHEASKKIAKLGKEMFVHYEDKPMRESLQAQIKTIEDGVRAAGHTPAVERAVFAEMWRLFSTKEFFLTTVLSIVIYACTKLPFMERVFEKIGFKKKEHVPAAVADVSAGAAQSSEGRGRVADERNKEPAIQESELREFKAVPPVKEGPAHLPDHTPMKHHKHITAKEGSWTDRRQMEPAQVSAPGVA